MSAKATGSKFVSAGVLLVLLGFSIPLVLERLMPGQTMSSPMAFLVDGFRVGFFVGLALLIIGLLRNRQAKKSDGTSA